MDWYWWIAVMGLLVLSGWAMFNLLRRITAWGGDHANGLENASRFSAEAEAFRGSRTPDEATLDGRNRIAPPTQDGGFTG